MNAVLRKRLIVLCREITALSAEHAAVMKKIFLIEFGESIQQAMFRPTALARMKRRK